MEQRQSRFAVKFCAVVPGEDRSICDRLRCRACPIVRKSTAARHASCNTSCDGTHAVSMKYLLEFSCRGLMATMLLAHLAVAV